MNDQTVMCWEREKLPEESGQEILEAFGCSFITVLVTGRYQPEGGLLVGIVNRMKRKRTGYPEIDNSDSLNVPLDEQWHWQSGMVEIVAWSPLPDKNDQRWIPCQTTLPEKVLRIHKEGRTQMLSVMALCEVFQGSPDVRLVNRLCIEKTGNPFFDELATNGWVWSKNGKNVKAWMPFPAPAEE